MIKLLGKGALVLTITLGGLSSCKKAAHVCDAYTYELRKQKIHDLQLSVTSTNNQLNN